MNVQAKLKVAKKKGDPKRRPEGRMYLVVVAIYERDLDEAGINAFRVKAPSQAAAAGIAESIAGTETWWEHVHGDDMEAREGTVYGPPCVLPVSARAFLYRPLLSPNPDEVGRAYGDDEEAEVVQHPKGNFGRGLALC